MYTLLTSSLSRALGFPLDNSRSSGTTAQLDTGGNGMPNSRDNLRLVPSRIISMFIWNVLTLGNGVGI